MGCFEEQDVEVGKVREQVDIVEGKVRFDIGVVQAEDSKDYS